MLMVGIFSWGRDIIMKPVDSVNEVHDLKRRLSRNDTDFVIYESNCLLPFKFDIAIRELTESEQVEWRMTEVYPALEAEGRMIRNKAGKWVRVPNTR